MTESECSILGQSTVSGYSCFASCLIPAFKCLSKFFVLMLNEMWIERYDLCMAIAGVVPDVILVREVILKAQVHLLVSSLLQLLGFDCFSSFDLGEHNLGGKGSHGICAYICHNIKDDDGWGLRALQT